MKNFATLIGECQFIRSMMLLRYFYSFDYSIRPSMDVSMKEARVKTYELKPLLTSQLAGDWKRTHYLS